MEETTERRTGRLQDAWATRPARPREGRMVAGVAAAVADRYGLDPVLVRVGFAVAAFYGPGIPLYLLGCAALPDARSTGDGRARAVLTTVLLAGAAVGMAFLLFGGEGGWLAPLMVCVGLLVLLHVTRGGTTPAGREGATTAPVRAAPLTTTTAGAASGDATGVGTAYGDTTPGGTTSGGTTPGDTTPGGTTPDGTTPGDTTPTGMTTTAATASATAVTAAVTPTDPGARTDGAPRADSGGDHTAGDLPGAPHGTDGTDDVTGAAGGHGSGGTVAVGNGSRSDRGAPDHLADDAHAPRPSPPSWDPLGVAPFAWDLPEPAPEQVPEPPPARRSRITPVTLALALLAGGAAGALALTLPGAVGPAAAPGAALAVVGIGLVAGAFRHAGRWLLPFAVLLAVATWVAAAVPWADLRGGVGTIADAPQSVSAVAPEYRRGIGDVALDLSGLDLTAAPGAPAPVVRTSTQVGVGSISVTVPRNADIVVRGTSGLGDVTVDGQSRSGDSPSLTVVDDGPDGPGGGRIEIDAHATLGSVTVGRG